MIFTELLQGFRPEREAARVERYPRLFPVLRLETLEDFAVAVRLCRQARRARVTVRKTPDRPIAAPCVRERAPILHADDDFDRLASRTPLRMFR